MIFINFDNFPRFNLETELTIFLNIFHLTFIASPFVPKFYSYLEIETGKGNKRNINYRVVSPCCRKQSSCVHYQCHCEMFETAQK